MPAGQGPEDDEDEWRFSLDELDERENEANGPVVSENGQQANEEEHIPEYEQPLEPGDIDLENAIFVVLGVLLVVGLIGAVFLGI